MATAADLNCQCPTRVVGTFGFAQHQAQVTSLAMLLPPLGFLAGWHYHTLGTSI